jgi:hypothetical protein
MLIQPTVEKLYGLRLGAMAPVFLGVECYEVWQRAQKAAAAMAELRNEAVAQVGSDDPDVLEALADGLEKPKTAGEYLGGVALADIHGLSHSKKWDYGDNRVLTRVCRRAGIRSGGYPDTSWGDEGYVRVRFKMVRDTNFHRMR